MNIFKRFKIILQSKNQNQAAWARDLGVSKTAIGRILSEKAKPGLAVLIPLLKMGYNINWLLTGEGVMLIKDIPPEEFTLPLDIQQLIQEKENKEQAITALNNTLEELAQQVERLEDQLKDKNALLHFYREKYPQQESNIK